MSMRFLLAGFTLFLSLLLAGCPGLSMSNMTPQKVPQNPSGIYTIAVNSQIRDTAVDPESIRMIIVIDGKTYPMVPSKSQPGMFEYDYIPAKGQAEAKYYTVLHYDVVRAGHVRSHSMQSDLHTIALSNRYVLTLESTRGPVGATIPVIGRGFTKFDVVTLDGNPAETTFHSANSLSFKVPTLPADHAYSVALQTGSGNLPVGTFRIDSSVIQAQPNHLTLATGERALIAFSIRNEAATGGLLLDITTDIPESILMPVAKIPSGARSVSVLMEGGRPGQGNLYVTAPGFKELVIPVSIRGDQLNAFEGPTTTSPDSSLARNTEDIPTLTPLPWQPLND